MTKTTPEKLIEIKEALIIDNNYLRTELAKARAEITKLTTKRPRGKPRAVLIKTDEIIAIAKQQGISETKICRQICERLNIKSVNTVREFVRELRGTP